MRAVYAKDGALCAVNGAIIAGTDTGEPPCACNGEPPVECEPDKGVCCTEPGRCTPIGDIPPGAITGNITATGSVIRRVTRKSFAGGEETQSANIPVAITTDGFGAVNLAPNGTDACRTYGGTFSRFQVSDNVLTELICPGPLAPVRNITYFLGGIAKFDPKGQLLPPGPFGGVGDNLATYTINLRVYDDFHLSLNVRVYRNAGRPAVFPASAQAIATVITTYSGAGPASYLPAVATVLNPCGTRLRVSITKPILTPPLAPESCPPLPNPLPSNSCTLGKSFGVDLTFDIELGDQFRACTNCEPEYPNCCPIGCFDDPAAIGWRPRLAGITPLGAPIWGDMTGSATITRVTEIPGFELTTYSLSGAGSVSELFPSNCSNLVLDLPMNGTFTVKNLTTDQETVTPVTAYCRFTAENILGSAFYDAEIVSGVQVLAFVRCTDNGIDGKAATLGPQARLSQNFTFPAGSINAVMTFGAFVRCDAPVVIGPDQLVGGPASSGCSGCGDSNSGGATI